MACFFFGNKALKQACISKGQTRDWLCILSRCLDNFVLALFITPTRSYRVLSKLYVHCPVSVQNLIKRNVVTCFFIFNKELK